MSKQAMGLWNYRILKVFFFSSFMIFPVFAMDKVGMFSDGEKRKDPVKFEIRKSETNWCTSDFRPQGGELKDSPILNVGPTTPLSSKEYFQVGGVPLKEDNRERIKDIGHECWRGVGLVTWKFGEATHSATAFLFTNNFIMTTASNVYDYKNKRWAHDVQFSPGRNGDTTLHHSVACGWKAVFSEWVEGGNPYYDMAILQLSADVGEKIGWYGLAWAQNDIVEIFEPINVIGYPQDKGPEVSLWWSPSKAQKCYGSQISMTMGAGPGFNGAPAWVQSDMLPDKGYYVVGVLASGASVEKVNEETRTYEVLDCLNFATRITQEKLLRIKAAIEGE